MDKFQVIAVGIPYLINFHSYRMVDCCVVWDRKLYLYTIHQELIPLGRYAQNINRLLHVINEGRFDWEYFALLPNQNVYRDHDNTVILDESPVISFQKHGSGRNRISEVSLKHFNDFLKICNRHNTEMQISLNQAYMEGVFRTEIEEIVNNDVVYNLDPLDKEIVVRTKLEGPDFLQAYVDKALATKKTDKYLEINHFFRRVFDLEVNNYVSFAG